MNFAVKRLTRLTTIGWGASAMAHAGGLLVAWFAFTHIEAITNPHLSGDRSRVELAAAWSMPKPEASSLAEPLLEVPVEVMPQRAKVGDRRFSNTPTTTGQLTARDVTTVQRLVTAVPMQLPRSRITDRANFASPSQPTLPRRRDTEPSPMETETPLEQASIARRPRTVGTTPDRLPELLNNLPPVYPSQAKERELEGRVILSVRVSPTGTVDSIEVLTGSGHEILDVAAVRAVWSWRFQPAIQSGQPAAATIHLPIRFSLD